MIIALSLRLKIIRRTSHLALRTILTMSSLTQHIYLLGFMACGKTTTGKRLAKIARSNFRDLDWIIEQKAGCSISTLFDQKGEAHFRRLEQFCLHETILMAPAVIATGGGTPCFFENSKQIQSQGISIYLQASPRFLTQRLIKQKEERPLVSHFEDATSLEVYIDKKLESRRAFYEQADYIISIEAFRPQDLAAEIWEFVKIHNR